MSHPIHHALEIRATSEKPRRVRVPKIMYPNTEVDARRFNSRQPHSGSEGVTRDRSAYLGAEQEFVTPNRIDPDVLSDLIQPRRPHTTGARLIVLRSRKQAV